MDSEQRCRRHDDADAVCLAVAARGGESVYQKQPPAAFGVHIRTCGFFRRTKTAAAAHADDDFVRLHFGSKERMPAAVAERIDEQFVGDQFAVKDRVLGNGLCLERTAHTLERRSERPNIVHLKLHLSHHRFLQGLPQFLQDLAFHARDVHL